jgi:hypothetical protein
MRVPGDVAEGKILPRERNVLINQAFDDIPVALAPDSEPVLLPAAKGPDVPPLPGEFIPPDAQAPLAKVVYMIERCCLAIAGRETLPGPAIELRDQAAVSGRTKLFGQFAMGLVL